MAGDETASEMRGNAAEVQQEVHRGARAEAELDDDIDTAATPDL